MQLKRKTEIFNKSLKKMVGLWMLGNDSESKFKRSEIGKATIICYPIREEE
jgi:hypothetical protein